MTTPEWMDHIWAKSPDRGGETLAQHTRAVLEQLAGHYQLRSSLVTTIDVRAWTRLYWGCFLHDFGKAARDFQSILRGEKTTWSEKQHRHEVLSLGFVDWLFPKGHIDRQWVIAVIASHHKDEDVIHSKYGGNKDWRQMTSEDQEDIGSFLDYLNDQIDGTTRQHLWRWIVTYGVEWANELGLPLIEVPSILSVEEALNQNMKQSIFRALRDYYDLHSSLLTIENRRHGIIARGLILTADHSASAHAPAFQSLTLSYENALGGLDPNQLRSHQAAIQTVGRGSAIMVAPTGSGKTEAAMIWAWRQAQFDGRTPPRLFYALPYQASMNAMHKRLKDKHFPSLPNPDDSEKPLDLVGLQHGHALQSLYHDLLTNDDNSREEATEQSRLKRELADLGIPPVRVFSPYQMLKAAYSLKGFEAMLTDYHGGLFIFDEIHAYEPKRLALIVELIGWLSRHFSARFLIMTATLPPTIKEVLEKALPGCETITASMMVYEESRRHKVRLLDGELLSEEGIHSIVSSVKNGQSVLVCLNTVRRAKEVFARLSELLPDMAANDFVLLHGRFNSEDRIKKEEHIQQRTGTRSETRRPTLVIATQVVEVSLDIDLDTIYTDPAPLEALLQRFGRVNRSFEIVDNQRRSRISMADVHVFREPSDGEKVCGIYNGELLRAGLETLERFDGQSIDEALVSDWLAEVYSGDRAKAWMDEYENAADGFRRDTLDRVSPFSSADKNLAMDFYRLFDGLEALPYELEPEYHRRRKQEGAIEASSLFVSMSFAQYKGLERSKLAWFKPDRYGRPLYYIVDAHYTSEMGLDLEEARERAKAGYESEDY